MTSRAQRAVFDGTGVTRRGSGFGNNRITMAEMNRLALLIPLLATCSSTGLRSHVPDAGFSNNDGVEGLQPEAGSPVAEIIETASANRAGFDVLVYSDGSATQTTVPSSGCPFLGADDTNCQTSSSYYPRARQSSCSSSPIFKRLASYPIFRKSPFAASRFAVRTSRRSAPVEGPARTSNAWQIQHQRNVRSIWTLSP